MPLKRPVSYIPWITAERARYDAFYAQAKAEWKAANAAKKKENGGRRFKEGKATAAHVSGYREAVKRRAIKLFGGPRP